ncbi:MAG: hypothetical protein H0U03_13455 [Actinobacteria bacterium]|nr:hypothetical protein [Actinomycetota bacterium]
MIAAAPKVVLSACAASRCALSMKAAVAWVSIRESVNSCEASAPGAPASEAASTASGIARR